MGRGARATQKFLRSGKNQCNIRAKHKNFWKILICPEKFFVSLRKLRDVRYNFLICPAKSPPPQQFWGEILMFSLSVRANYTVPPQTRLGPYAHV
jgi:hypothetical protein